MGVSCNWAYLDDTQNNNISKNLGKRKLKDDLILFLLERQNYRGKETERVIFYPPVHSPNDNYSQS